jgi:methylenetetrahydrofolate dehydrogenase (NADP+)/methenyltetrahydrofolate cyclohydrolase
MVSMSAQLLDGKAAAAAWEAELSAQIKTFSSKPKLVLVRVGDDPASGIYVKRKVEACSRIGLISEVRHLPATTSQKELLACVEMLNADKSVHGILVQVPLPKSIDPLSIQQAIHPYKDVDGFGTKSMGLLLMGTPRFAAATPAGILRLLSHYHLCVAKKHCVVVGRSNIVGKPLAMLLLQEDATVTIAHSKTSDLGAITRQADFLFAAVGKPHLIKIEMVKKGAVVIDVGINRVETKSDSPAKPELEPLPQPTRKNASATASKKKLVGDVEFDSVSTIASWITPVPGGVGPMTIASLLANTVKAYSLEQKK